jgi:hypothetical protein
MNFMRTNKAYMAAISSPSLVVLFGPLHSPSDKLYCSKPDKGNEIQIVK